MSLDEKHGGMSTTDHMETSEKPIRGRVSVAVDLIPVLLDH